MKSITDTQQGFLKTDLKKQKQLPKPLVLPYLLVKYKFGTVTYKNLKK